MTEETVPEVDEYKGAGVRIYFQFMAAQTRIGVSGVSKGGGRWIGDHLSHEHVVSVRNRPGIDNI
jgi:hypothetical protein